MAAGEGDDGAVRDERTAHPLVATRALLERRASALPSSVAERPASGHMPRGAFATVMDIAEALFSVGGEAPPAPRLAFLSDEFDDFMARASSQGRFLFTWAARLVSWLAPLGVGRRPGLGRLELPLRVRALARFERGPGAPLLLALRAILCLIYYEHPDAAREVGLEVAGPAGAPLLQPPGDAP